MKARPNTDLPSCAPTPTPRSSANPQSTPSSRPKRSHRLARILDATPGAGNGTGPQRTTSGASFAGSSIPSVGLLPDVLPLLPSEDRRAIHLALAALCTTVRKRHLPTGVHPTSAPSPTPPASADLRRARALLRAALGSLAQAASSTASRGSASSSTKSCTPS